MAERGLVILRVWLALVATFVAAIALVLPACAQAADSVGGENLAQAAASLAATGSNGAATIVAQAQALVPQVASGPANGSGVGAPGQSGEATSGGAPALPVSVASDVASPPASPAATERPTLTPPHVNAPPTPTVVPPPAQPVVTTATAGRRGGGSPSPVHVSLPGSPTASDPSSPVQVATSVPPGAESVLGDDPTASAPSPDPTAPALTSQAPDLPTAAGSRCAAAALQADVSTLISCVGQNPAAGALAASTGPLGFAGFLSAAPGLIPPIPGAAQPHPWSPAGQLVSLRALLLQWLGGAPAPGGAGAPVGWPDAASHLRGPLRPPPDFPGASARLIGRGDAPAPPPIRRPNAGRERRREPRQAATEASSATAPDQPGLAPGTTGGSAATASAGIGSGATAGLALAFVSLCALHLLSGRASLELSAWRSTLFVLRLERPG
jgi:hypothetical protein